MARRTPAQALETRSKLLDAAEELFYQNGVSQTSLKDIASAAGATRGAIYWHFKDKVDLFNAMISRVDLPLEQALKDSMHSPSTDALNTLRNTIKNTFLMLANNEQARRVFEICMHKTEYVDNLLGAKQRHLGVRCDCVALFKIGLIEAARQNNHTLPIPENMAAAGLFFLIDGILKNWLLDPSQFNVSQAGMMLLDSYLKGLGFNAANFEVQK